MALATFLSPQPKEERNEVRTFSGCAMRGQACGQLDAADQ